MTVFYSRIGNLRLVKPSCLEIFTLNHFFTNVDLFGLCRIYNAARQLLFIIDCVKWEINTAMSRTYTKIFVTFSCSAMRRQ